MEKSWVVCPFFPIISHVFPNFSMFFLHFFPKDWMSSKFATQLPQAAAKPQEFLASWDVTWELLPMRWNWSPPKNGPKLAKVRKGNFPKKLKVVVGGSFVNQKWGNRHSILLHRIFLNILGFTLMSPMLCEQLHMASCVSPVSCHLEDLTVLQDGSLL